MHINANAADAVPTPVVISLRCPNCRQIGTLETFGNVPDLRVGAYQLGQRRCPNPACHAHVFTVYSHERRQLAVAYPAERIDFDASEVPPTVTTAIEEAITCHANQCFKASAIMVRRTLEELCRDRGANGKDLKARLASLETKVVLPKELLEAMDDLRLLGNDAAHVESQEYDDVGQEEVEAGLAVTKEVLKAVYQYSALVKQLRNLKKTTEREAV